MLKISCLHSAQSSIAIFEAARRELALDDVILKHRVRSDLLATVATERLTTPDTARRAVDEVLSVARGADAVLVTCSTIGEAARAAIPRIKVPLRRADDALAQAATGAGGTVIALCEAAVDIAPMRRLFESWAIASSATVELRMVPEARDLLTAGQNADYLRLIAEAAEAAAEEAGTVALIQATMAAAAKLTRCHPLTTPATGLAAIVSAARAHRSARS